MDRHVYVATMTKDGPKEYVLKCKTRWALTLPVARKVLGEKVQCILNYEHINWKSYCSLKDLEYIEAIEVDLDD